MTRLRVLLARLLGLLSRDAGRDANYTPRSTRTSPKPQRNSSVKAFRLTRRAAFPSRNSEA